MRVRAAILSASCVLVGCRSDATKANAVPPGSAPAASSTPAIASAPPAPVDPDKSCDARVGVPERRRGWPRVAAADVISGKRSDAVEIDARVEKVTPGYDCGGAPTECEGKLRPFEVAVRSDDGTLLLLTASPSERGKAFITATRYAFSVVTCTRNDQRIFEVRGLEPLDRARGAEVDCRTIAVAPPSARLEGWPPRKLPELARHLVEPGGFDTEGIVVQRYVPTPCPPGATCKPQSPPHIVIAERADAPMHTLSVQTPEPNAVALHARVRASVVVCGTRTVDAPINDGYLRALVLGN